MSEALIVIDVQESFRARAGWPTFANQNVTEQVQALVSTFRAAGDSVFWVLHAQPRSGGVFDPVLGHVRVMSELKPLPDEPLIIKTSINAFTTTNLQQQLVERGIRGLTICGIRTEQCCETTARIASDLGFHVTFVTDATTTSPAGSLTAAQIIERTEEILREREFATIKTTQEITAERAPV